MTQRINKIKNAAGANTRQPASTDVLMNNTHNISGKSSAPVPRWVTVLLGCYGVNAR